MPQQARFALIALWYLAAPSQGFTRVAPPPVLSRSSIITNALKLPIELSFLPYHFGLLERIKKNPPRLFIFKSTVTETARTTKESTPRQKTLTQPNETPNEVLVNGEADWLDRLNHKVEGGLGPAVLLGATALSLGLSNSPVAGAWLSFWNQPTVLSAGQHVLTVKDFVNEGLM